MRSRTRLRKNAGLLLAGAALLLFSACAKDNTVRNSVSHPAGWSDTTSIDFHGGKVLVLNSTGFCAGCHGADFTGGRSGSSCRACHTYYPHPDGWTDMNSLKDHGRLFETGTLDTTHFARCMTCHGPALAGGRVPKKCNDCHDNVTVAVWAARP
ncbi:MAG: cytochrome c3 family protein [Fibrobacterota bacterium]